MCAQYLSIHYEFQNLKTLFFLSVNKSITVIDTHFLHVKIGKEGFLKPQINYE